MIKVDYSGMENGREEVTLEISLDTYVNKLKPFLRRQCEIFDYLREAFVEDIEVSFRGDSFFVCSQDVCALKVIE